MLLFLYGNFIKYRKIYFNKIWVIERNYNIKYIVSKKINFLNDMLMGGEDILEKYSKKVKENCDLKF